LANDSPTEQEKSFTARNGGPTWPEDCFLSPISSYHESRTAGVQ